jgi:hypothetical protein
MQLKTETHFSSLKKLTIFRKSKRSEEEVKSKNRDN